MPETPEKVTVETASPKTSPSKKEIDAATSALNHFAQGKRHLIVGDIPSAVNALQEACKLLAEQYGETAPECGDAYFCYGKALLEMARMESGVIGNALDGVPEGEDADNSQVENPEKLTDTEKNEVTDLVDKALEDNFEDLEKKKQINKEKTKKAVNGQGSETNGKLENGDEKMETTTQENEKAKNEENVKEKAENEKETAKNEENVKEKSKNGEKEKAKNDNKDEGSESVKVENGDDKMETSHDDDDKKDDPKSPSKKVTPGEESKSVKKEGSTENEEEESSEGDAESQDGESAEGESQEGTSQEEGDAEADAEAEMEAKEGEGDKTEEDEEDVSNLQLSWEMLELAKVIFQKQVESNPKMNSKVAEVYLKLGEVGLESENYPQGIADFKECLQLQKKVLDSDDRCLAETHYQLGIAYSFGDEFDLAIECFKAAVEVLETRISNLNKIKKEKENWTEEQKKNDAATRVDPFYTEQGEIDELHLLLPEMKEKIVDMEQMKKDSQERLKAAKEAMMSNVFGGESSQGGSSSSNAFGAPSTSSTSTSSSAKEAKPIMVVRKKRKIEDEANDESKKIKGENGQSISSVNGSKMTNGDATTNTDSAPKEESQANGKVTEESKTKSPEELKKVEMKTV